MTRRACSMCRGTDTQYECERGQCYAEHMRYQQECEERAREEEYRRYCEEQERDQ